MKVLCICEHGNVRSVALAYLIKTIYGHEAIAIGEKTINDDTLSILADWSDKIIKFTPGYGAIMGGNGKKVTHLLIGDDIWFNPFHHNLQHKLLKKLKDLNL